jgi:hypothetical protein
MSEKTNTNQQDKNYAIKEQIEYYLSDTNLEHDAFFHQKITEDPNRYLDLELLLKCNKCKNAGWTLDDIKSGIKLSENIELDKEEKKVRRKDNKPLPELALLSQKRKNEEENKKEENEENEESVELEKKDPVILMFTCEEQSFSNWKDICKAFKDENPELKIIYSRFRDTLGHLAVIPDKDYEVKFKDKFKYEGVEFTVKNCENEDLIDFFKEHGNHYKMCLEMHQRKNKKGKKNQSKGKNKKNKKAKKENTNNNNTELKKEVILGEQKFQDAALIKAETRKIINDTKDYEKLKDKDQKFILDLLKYHHNYEDKCKDLDYVTVGKPENYDSSRCFVIVNKKNEKKDFSVQKCIDNLVEKINAE